MPFDLQPTLGDGRVLLAPLRADDFSRLYAVASDPLIWEQHPNRNRYQEAEFRNYFQGAMESGGALLIAAATSGETIGSSRFYDLDVTAGTIAIGYTFLARKYWGGATNRALKTLMLDHAFGCVARVVFHVGEHNTRSRTAMERLGGVIIGKTPIAYYGEAASTNVIYAIDRDAWRAATGPSATPSGRGPGSRGVS
jgi:RimJ/RimL family protein N-acetyltransferase